MPYKKDYDISWSVLGGRYPHVETMLSPHNRDIDPALVPEIPIPRI